MGTHSRGGKEVRDCKGTIQKLLISSHSHTFSKNHIDLYMIKINT